MTTELQARLSTFVQWCHAHILGDEKGEAQIFLDQFFRAFGHGGFKEAGATCETRIKNEKNKTSFADLVWRPVVLIEMKKRGENLGKHYSQAFTYWTRLVPDRPNMVILCNFDEFWIYDFNSQMDSPVDIVKLIDLPHRFGPLTFLLPQPIAPVFGNHQETVTRQAADKLAHLFKSLVGRGVDRALAQRFSLQALMALFAEDIGLIEKYFFARLLEDCNTPEASYDLLGRLFMEMNTPGNTPGGRFKGIPYFNGGLFSSPAQIELHQEEVMLLREAAKFDWSKVRPEIFGVIFEHSMDADERRAFGAHYTSPLDIMKVVGPTIVEPWTQKIESAKTLSELERLLLKIENFKVLDPACGSGNFLYITYRELKRLEARIYERMGTYKSIDSSQRPMGFLSTRNFFGIDINPFAVELAKVTMMLAHKLAIDELHIQEQALPLDNLDANFYSGDALINPSGQQTPWPDACVIVGNPPFLGAKLLKPKQGVEYVRRLRKAYPEVPGMADLCVYWLWRAERHLRPTTSVEWEIGRAGLVGTQNIRNNASRVGGLDHITAVGTIVDAVQNQPWSGEAAVHVSIVNWIKTKEIELIPKVRRLWFEHKKQKSTSKAKTENDIAHKFELDMREVDNINSSLSDQLDISSAVRLVCNINPPIAFQGITPGHKAFVLSEAERNSLPKPELVLTSPYLVGDEVLGGVAERRYLLNFEKRTVLEAKSYPFAFQRIEKRVLPDRIAAAEKGKDDAGIMRPHHRQFLERWWQLSWARAEMVSVISPLNRYIACSRVTKRPIFFFVNAAIQPGDALQVFCLSDDYSFGILQSAVHYDWFHAKCSNMKVDPRYSSESIFDTFPWPQKPLLSQIRAVAEAGRKIREVRNNALKAVEGGLRNLYSTFDLPGENPLRTAHLELDRLVKKAYGFSEKDDLKEKLFMLNQQIDEENRDGAISNGPGLPKQFSDDPFFISEDAFGD
ncbi:N-6 DNA methylase [Massilia sp. DJPM01]|uniref:DNA methyltransferase n=1 Tax=Massilia sp. DJPM01 TaxID=3024404 RepID=UPI00259D7278|nr:DNA methyltransferase [Massilia sp. DJPM01]MDM5180807.1 N-6 DNA methylase [Massilia sp. DJPM01]